MADDADGKFTEFMVFAIGQGLRRGNHDRFTRMDAQRVEILHVTNRDAIIKTVAHHFVFHFLPALEALLYQNLRREREGFFRQYVQFFFVIAKARTKPAQSVCGTDNDGITQIFSRPTCLLNVLACLALNGLHINFIELLHKEFAVFGVHNGLYGRTEHTRTVFLEHAFFIKRHTAIQCRLPSKREQHAVGTFLVYYFLHKIRSNGKEINLIRHAFRSLYRGNIGVDKHRFDAFFFQGFQGLASRIVELARLADFQRA